MASPDTTFQDLMDDMKALALRQSQYLLDATTTSLYWMLPTTPGWTFDPTGIPTLGDPFDRTQLRADYKAEYEGTGDDETRVVTGVAIQLGYMGMMERAFRERHKTVVRAFAHAASRQKAHGDATHSVHTASVLAYVQEVLTA